MADFEWLFDQIEQWKRDHPDYERARQIIEEARHIIQVYEAQKRTQLHYETRTGDSSEPLRSYWRCPKCGDLIPTSQFQHYCTRSTTIG